MDEEENQGITIMTHTLQLGFEAIDGQEPEDYNFRLWVWEDEEILLNYSMNYRLVGGKFEMCPNLVHEAIDTILFLVGLKREDYELEAAKNLSDDTKLDHIFWVYSLDVLPTLKSIDVYYD